MDQRKGHAHGDAGCEKTFAFRVKRELRGAGRWDNFIQKLNLSDSNAGPYFNL